MNTKCLGVFTALATSFLVLWNMLLPGYVLSMDLVFTPYFHYSPAFGEVLNGAPLWYLIQLLNIFMPGWLVEKVVLLTLFFLLSFISYTFLPVPKRTSVRLFASLIYTANTFVYIRLLAGQWTILFAYALLPLFMHLLISSTKNAKRRTGIALGAVLALIAVFSLHLFLMAVLISLGWWVLCKAPLLLSGNFRIYTKCATQDGFVLLTVLVLTSYWTIPLLKAHSVVSAFTSGHWEAFAASGNGNIPVLLNLAMLGGFWGEAWPWATYFVWPQQHVLFWISWTCILLLSIVGTRALWKLGRKGFASFMVIIAIFSIVFGAGNAATPFQIINVFLYEHIPFWTGFRDSHKFIAFLALSYAVLAGYGFNWLVTKIQTIRQEKVRPIIPYLVALLFLIPLAFGMYVWGGFAKQLQPVWYPASWEQARAELLQHPNENALILPWQGYFSLAFNRNLIVANPGKQYFGPQAVVSENVRLGDVYDQATDPEYKELDYAIRENGPSNGQPMAQFLKSRNIHYVLYLQDLANVDNFSYDFLESNDFKPLWATADLIFYQIQ